MKQSTRWFILGFTLCAPLLIAMGYTLDWLYYLTFGVAVIGVLCVFHAVHYTETEDQFGDLASHAVRTTCSRCGKTMYTLDAKGVIHHVERLCDQCANPR